MKALILAAGYATRLYPLTKHFPKPLLKLGKKPIIDYIVDKLDKIDEIDEIFVITNSKFYSRFVFWKKTQKTKKRITLIDDLTKAIDDRRGAIGDMYFAVSRKKISSDLLVIGGDNIFDGSLADFIDFSKRKKPYASLGVYDLKYKRQASRYGVIKLGAGASVADFKEKPAKPDSALVAMCLYFFPKSKLGLLKVYAEKKKNKSDASGFYIDWLRQRDKIYGFIFRGKWFDIGDKQFYKKAKSSF